MISYVDAIRLKVALKLTPVELAILVCVLDSEEPVIRSRIFRAARDASPACKHGTDQVFRVQLCKLNAKLPGLIRIAPVFPNGVRGRRGVGAGTQKACAFELTQGRETLLKLASEPTRKPSERTP